MVGYVSLKHANAKADLIYGLRLHLKTKGRGFQTKLAEKLGMGYNDFMALLRLDRAVSLSKLEEIGNAAGLKLVMRWEPNDGIVQQNRSAAPALPRTRSDGPEVRRS